jgi:hypothetical protein
MKFEETSVDVGLGFKLVKRNYTVDYIDHYYLVYYGVNVAEVSDYWDGYRVTKFITGDNPEATRMIRNVISRHNEQIAYDIEYNKRVQTQDNLAREDASKEKALKALGLL